MKSYISLAEAARRALEVDERMRAEIDEATKANQSPTPEQAELAALWQQVDTLTTALEAIQQEAAIGTKEGSTAGNRARVSIIERTASAALAVKAAGGQGDKQP